MTHPVHTITQYARRYGLDPRAVIAVAQGEGGLVNRENDIGDLAGGGSYGPFQLYAQGMLPKQYRGNPKAADAWAWSPAGIDYALKHMSSMGARGLTGRAAVEAIIRKFERPADPDASVAAALKRLGSGSDGPAPSAGGGPVPFASGAGSPPGDNFLGSLLGAFQHGGQQRTNAILGAILSQQTAPTSAGSASGAPPSPAAAASGASGSGAYGAQAMVNVIEQAKRLGLAVRENPYAGDTVDPVHTKGSHHYRTLGKVNGRLVGGGADISGDAAKLRALFAWIRQRYPKIPELIYDPVGSIFDGTYKAGAYGGHGSHLHAGF